MTRTISTETARLIGTHEAFSRAQIRATEVGFSDLKGAMQHGFMDVTYSVDRLGDRLSGDVTKLTGVVHAGFDGVARGLDDGDEQEQQRGELADVIEVAMGVHAEVERPRVVTEAGQAPDRPAPAVDEHPELAVLQQERTGATRRIGQDGA